MQQCEQWKRVMLLYIYIVPTGHQGRDSPTLTGAIKEGIIIIIIIIQHNIMPI